MKNKPFWFLIDPYGWLIVLMSIITAVIIKEWWIVLLGAIGYLIVLLTNLTLGRNLGQTGVVRLARTEQENRELRAEQARLLGAIEELDEQIKQLETQQSSPAEEPQDEELKPEA